jgi:hypothetical protein
MQIRSCPDASHGEDSVLMMTGCTADGYLVIVDPRLFVTGR